MYDTNPQPPQPDIPLRLAYVEAEINSLISACGDLTDCGAVWAGIDRATAEAARSRVLELGGDADAMRAALDKFFLQYPAT